MLRPTRNLETSSMTTQDKLAIGLDHGMFGAEWGLCTDYAELVRTWRDERPVPTEEQILAWFDEAMTQPDKETVFVDMVEAGYPVEPEGFSLGITDNDRKNWSEMAVMLREAEALGVAPETVQIVDLTGTVHTVTLSRYRQIIVGLGSYYQYLFFSRIN